MELHFNLFCVEKIGVLFYYLQKSFLLLTILFLQISYHIHAKVPQEDNIQSTVGINTATVQKYIREQDKADQITDSLRTNMQPLSRGASNHPTVA